MTSNQTTYSNGRDEADVKHDTITFYKQVCFTLTYKKFRKNYCEDDMTDAEALRLWAKMTDNAGDNLDVKCEDDGCENEDWAEDDIAQHRDEAEDDIAEQDKKAKEDEEDVPCFDDEEGITTPLRNGLRKMDMDGKWWVARDDTWYRV
jgi:hypothetical protein